MQPTEQAELVPAFLIPIQMRMHMHVLVKFVLPRSRHVCRHTQKGRERDTGITQSIVRTRPSLFIRKKQCFCIYGRCIWGIIGLCK